MRVAILGCGYVGLELGARLRDIGHDVVGVRRSEAGLAAVEDAGLDPVAADVTDADSLAAVPDVDAVVFAASAGGRGAEAARATYVEGLETAVEQFGGRDDPPDRLVYTSSTGVYGDHDGDWVDEDTALSPADDRTAALVDAEGVALDAAPELGIDPTVVRFGGIYGPDRFRLERYLDGPVTEGYLNLVHRADAAGMVAFLLAEGLARGEMVVGVDDEPVDRADLSRWLADQLGRDPPGTRSVEERLAAADVSEGRARRLRADKRCSNAKLRDLGYAFTYPTFREGLRNLVDARTG
jgi:nucleoside-diphosphate-sugar epimerase